MTGKCPNCGEVKEITSEGVVRGMCDDCYTKKYTCVICNKMMTNPWDIWYEPNRGTGHKVCFSLTEGHHPTE